MHKNESKAEDRLECRDEECAVDEQHLDPKA